MSNEQHSSVLPPFAHTSGTQARYKVLASLGRGGMANVYLAALLGPAGFNKLLVLKVLRDDLEERRSELVEMFLDEARLAARLQHRNIVQTYEFGEIAGRLHMSMEFLEGQALRTVQRKLLPQGLPLPEELRIVAQAARGLHHAHELKGLDGLPLGVVHRDVSPQNVFVTYDGDVKVLDFGIAKNLDAEHATRVGVIKGKIDYIAPEQIRGEGVDRRSDIFALGVMLWEAVAGQRFSGGSSVEDVTKFHKRLTGGEQRLRDVAPDAPEPLVALVEKAIALPKVDRFATAAQLADGIDAYLESLPTRPSAQSLSALLTGAFVEERESLRRIIEERVGAIEAAERRRGPRSGAHALDPSLTMSGMVDLSLPSSVSSIGLSSVPSLGMPLQGTGTPALEPAPPLTRRWRLPVLAAASVSVALVLGLYDWSQGSGEQAAAPAPAPAPEQVTATTDEGARSTESVAGVPTPATIQLSVSVTPSDAEVRLDGAPLPELPFRGAFRKAGDTHHLEVSAAGYEAVRQLVTFDQDREITIALRRKEAPARARRVKHTPRREPAVAPSEPVAEPPSPAPESQAAAAPATAPGVELRAKARRRSFDMNDPYAE